MTIDKHILNGMRGILRKNIQEAEKVIGTMSSYLNDFIRDLVTERFSSNKDKAKSIDPELTSELEFANPDPLDGCTRIMENLDKLGLDLQFDSFNASILRIGKGNKRFHREEICKLNQKYNLCMPETFSDYEVISSIWMTIKEIKREGRNLRMLSEALNREGVSKPVNRLPYFILILKGFDPAYSYVALSGIKRNAEEKTDIIDEQEEKSFNYEKKLAKYISGDYSVALYNLEEFLRLYRDYLSYCSSGEDFELNIPFEEVIDKRLIAMAHYIIYKTLGISLNSEEYAMMNNIIAAALKGDRNDLPEVLEFLCAFFVDLNEQYKRGELSSQESPLEDLVKDGHVVKSYSLYKFLALLDDAAYPASMKMQLEKEMREMLDQEIFGIEKILGDFIERFFRDVVDRMEYENRKMDTRKEQDEVASIEERDEIFDYIENGVVSVPCDLETFRELLEKSSLCDLKKVEYEAQMINLINRRAQEAFDRRLVECRARVLTAQELELYELAKTNKATSSTAKDIDAIVELMLDEMDDEDMMSLREELKPCFEYLRCMFVVEEDEEEPNIVYFTEKVGDDTVPVLLKSLLVSTKDNYKPAYIQLNKLLAGLTTGDREVRGDNLPCRLFAKKGDFKIFYTTVGDTIVVIDGAKGEDAYARVISIVKSTKFKDFLASVREYTSKGGKSKSKKYTELLLGELEKSKAVRCEKEEIPKLAYYTRKIVDSTGKEAVVPVMMMSLAWCEEADYKDIYSSITNLLKGLTRGDESVKAKGLPCRVYYKGRGVKLFYTLIDDCVFVIDAIPDVVGGSYTAFSQIARTVKSTEFGQALAEMRARVQSGEVVDARIHTKSVLRELEKEPSVKKSL